MAKFFLAQKKINEALELYQKSLNIPEKLASHNTSNNMDWPSGFYSVYHLIWPLLIEMNQFDKAAEISQRTIAHALKQDYSKVNKGQLARVYNNLAWFELWRREPKNAIEASEQGLKLNVNEIMNAQLNTNLAHGYLFSGQYQQAKERYLNYKDKTLVDGRSFKQAVLDDFKELRKHGINHPDMKKIEKLLR